MMNNRIEMNENMLDQVNGGYFIWNKYDKTVYNIIGIKVTDNFWSKDEFTLPDGTVTDADGANAYADANYTIEDISVGLCRRYKITDKSTGTVIFEDPRA